MYTKQAHTHWRGGGARQKENRKGEVEKDSVDSGVEAKKRSERRYNSK